jgi:hypothetical protein
MTPPLQEDGSSIDSEADSQPCQNQKQNANGDEFLLPLKHRQTENLLLWIVIVGKCDNPNGRNFPRQYCSSYIKRHQRRRVFAQRMEVWG